ncbi:FG-GAP-like repeat-containing protein [Microbulbifer sp. SSSA007]|uniref:FG-GAP-like repeat-containing protein n=1 Tax=Microbulbifer sp. SSSA007 TaxID=3243379 RepID=UPI004039C508
MSIYINKPWIKLINLATMSIILTACGGGSSNSSSNSEPSSGQGDGANNTPPVINSLLLSPEQAYNDTPLSIQLDATDEDGDQLEVSYIWKNNEEVIGEATNSNLEPAYFNRGDNILVEASVTDGKDTVTQTASITIQNRTPVIENLSFINLPVFTQPDLQVTSTVSDEDGDQITSTYRWSVNQKEVIGVTTDTLPSDYFSKDDQITVTLIASDGDLATELSASTEVQDSLPVLTIVNMPETAQYGAEATFQIVAEDFDNDPFTLEFQARPNGMEMDESGMVSWTPTGPMFDTEMDVTWEILLTQSEYSHSESRTIKVLDQNRQFPLARGHSNIFSKIQLSTVGDFDGDGAQEVLSTSQNSRRLSIWGYDGSDFAINWEYPFSISSYNDGLSPASTISSVASADFDGNGLDEILVGLKYYNSLVGDPPQLGLYKFNENFKPAKISSVDGYDIHEIKVYNLDNDPNLEIILLVQTTTSPFPVPDGYQRKEKLVILDSTDFSIKWQSESLALGTNFTIGNLDLDDEMEIVTGNGFLLDRDGNSYKTAWHYENGFTREWRSIETADINMDGVEEIIGIHPDTGYLTAYDTITKSIIAENPGSIDYFRIIQPPEETSARFVTTSGSFPVVYSFSPDTLQFTSLLTGERTIPNQFSSNVMIFNMDGDPELEYLYYDGKNLAIFSENPGDSKLQLEWNSDERAPNFRSYMLPIEQHESNTSEIHALVLSNSLDEPTYVFSLDSSNGKTSLSPEIYLPKGDDYDTQLTLLDLQDDGIKELVFVNNERPGIYDFFSESIIWSGEATGSDPRHMVVGKLGNNTESSIVVTNEDSSLQAYNANTYELIWSNTSDGGNHLELFNINNSGKMGIAVSNYDKISILTEENSYQSPVFQFQINDTPDEFRDPIFSENIEDIWFNPIETGDIDGDSIDEIIVTMGLRPEYNHHWMMILNQDLSVRSVAYLPDVDRVNAIQIQNYGLSHRNILLAIAKFNTVYIAEMDPKTGKTISISPELASSPWRHMNFTDTNKDGIYELTWLSGELTINVTR